MKVFLGNLPIGDVPGPRRQVGEFFPRLVGIRISSDENCVRDWIEVEPIYIPLVRIARRAGQVIIEINNTRPLVYITLQRWQPYIHIFYFPWWLWDQEEP